MGNAGTDAAIKVASVAKVKEYVSAGTIDPGTYVLVSGDVMTGDLKFAEDRNDGTIPNMTISKGGTITKPVLRYQSQETPQNNSDIDYYFGTDGTGSPQIQLKNSAASGPAVRVYAGGTSAAATKASIDFDGIAKFQNSVRIGSVSTGSNSNAGVNAYNVGSLDVQRSTSGPILRGFEGSSENVTLNSNGSATFSNTVTVTNGSGGSKNIL